MTTVPRHASAAHLGEALNAVRAAIDVVQRGSARRVIVSDPDGDAILATARVLGRAAGVTVEPSWRADGGACDIVVRASRFDR